MKKTRKRKIYHQVFRVEGKSPSGKLTFIEFGWVENPTFGNDIYLDVVSAHKGGEFTKEMRTDEALIFIQGLAQAINYKLTGIELIKKRNKKF